MVNLLVLMSLVLVLHLSYCSVLFLSWFLLVVFPLLTYSSYLFALVFRLTLGQICEQSKATGWSRRLN